VSPKTAANRKEVLETLSALPDDEARARFLARRSALVSAESVNALCEEARALWRVETRKALALAQAAVFLARRLDSGELLALSLRTLANALYFRGDNKAAVETHQQALALLEEMGQAEEIARTLSASIQPMILIGEYDRAIAAARRAREIFTEQRNERRLANLDINVGNIYHRQDRFPEAMTSYQRAYDQYVRSDNAEGTAVALHNMAVSQISLNDFPGALASHQRARDLAQRHNMPLLAAQADYNIAYLFYLRGEYGRGIQMLREARQNCETVGDAYHQALCYLDLSEIYLELNLSPEAAESSQEAARRFEQLGMGYEHAKALTFHAIALSQQGKAFQGVELMGQAREIFVRESNVVWPWLIDLYRALVLFNEGRLFEARRICANALEFFRSSLLPGKAVLCQLLLARIELKTGNAGGAQQHCAAAIERLAKLEAPALGFQAHFLMGQIEEARSDGKRAYDAYQLARAALETLRSSLAAEELKIAFMKNKLEVYEALVELCLTRGHEASPEGEAFGYMERAKSRSLTDLLSGVHLMLPGDPGQSELVQKVRGLREELNWYYHRIEIEQFRSEERSPERIQGLQEQARQREHELLRILHDRPALDPASAGLQESTPVTLDALRATLPAAVAVIEYFRVRERILAALITRERCEIVPLTPLSRVVNLMRMLQFQLSKFRLGAEYARSFAGPMLEATREHLRELHQELLAPLLQLWQGEHIVFVPHDVLHYLPFHALHDGRKYLLDSCSVSYAPSATVYALCHAKPPLHEGASLVLGVPDAQAPFILEEARAVAGMLPAAELYLREDARLHVLKEKGRAARWIHIAAHGSFRQDNPMFSGIRLGDGHLGLYDLYQLQLPAELVTLSGCATGMNVVAAGDELLGLVRGLLSAGAQSLLLSLWDVHDESTAEFMKLFYARLPSREDKAQALRQAMLEQRERYPHPYYWAPFLLIGKVLQT